MVGPALSPIVLGAMWRRLQGADAERERLVREAIDLGITSIDTAPLYDFGGSEVIVGRAIRGVQGRVQVLTKVGLRWDGDHGETLFSAQIDGARRAVRRDSRPEAIRRDVEDSLRRLGVETLDLVQIHHRDRDTEIAESVGELLRLRAEGKLRAIGVSNFEADEIEAVARELGEVRLATVQEPFSLLERTVEDAALSAARSVGAGLLCYSPLERGILAGCLQGLPEKQWPKRGPLFEPKNARRIHAAIDESLRPIAEANGVTIAQVALAWLLGTRGVVGVICGASTREQLSENARAASVELDADERAHLGQTFAALRLDRSAGESIGARAKRRARRLARRILRR